MKLANLFSTPVASFSHAHLTEINDELQKILIKESLSSRSLQVSNIGNWHSEYNLQGRPENCFQYLSNLIKINTIKVVEQLAKQSGLNYPRALTPQLTMWAMVMRAGNYTKPHTHASSHWSVVYYPYVEDTSRAAHNLSGAISFLDPRISFLPVPGIDLGSGEFQVMPESGQMLIFPGWLTHYVHTYFGDQPRVSIACNVNLAKAEQL